MKCEIMIGAGWDNINEVLLDWDKRTQCPNDATMIYHFKVAKTDLFLCSDHCQGFDQCAGNLEPYEE